MVSPILLSPADNIVVLPAAVSAGTSVLIDDANVTLTEDIALGHKVARRPIAVGEKILKYGVAIGSATRAIEAGEHVHLHNMKSDYLPTYTLAKERAFSA